MTPDDQFILSKGHGVMALYAVLEEKGLLNWDIKLMGHPKRGEHILASTGSLGHGLPMAVGLAKAKKIKGEKGRVFCLIGDGECNEGTIWESASLASHHKLDNLTVFVDNNGSSTRALDNLNLVDKFKAFGWEELRTQDKPEIIVVNTIKGNGIKDFQLPEWHNRKITNEDYERFINEL
jgi:transketolase